MQPWLHSLLSSTERRASSTVHSNRWDKTQASFTPHSSQLPGPHNPHNQKSGFARVGQIVKGKMVALIMACTLLAK
jgi:hypothetical protein